MLFVDIETITRFARLHRPAGGAGVEGDASFNTGLVGASHLQDLPIIQYNPLRG